MTERKPPGMRYEDWIERQIREARERGEFDNLAGAGKPLRNLDRPFSAAQWALDRIEREGGDLKALLPPMLALRKERAALLASLADVPTETVLRATLDDFNARLLDQYRRPMDGPLIAVGVIDVEETVGAWRTLHPPAPAPAPPPPPEPRPRWWSRFRRPR